MTKRLAVAMVLVTAIAALSRPVPAAIQTSAAPRDPRALFAAAISAREKGDLAGYLRNLRDAAALRPTHPIVLYHLAAAHALNHQPERAGDVLRQLVALAVYRDAAHDPDFASVVDHSSVRRALRDLERLRLRRIGTAAVYRTIPDPSFIPEGIALDPLTHALFVSSQHKRKIVRVDPNGAITDFVSEGQDGIWMVFGIAIDSARRPMGGQLRRPCDAGLPRRRR